MKSMEYQSPSRNRASNEMVKMKKNENPQYGIIVHGGAGTYVHTSAEEYTKRRDVLRRCATRGFEVLSKGGSSTDAVEEAIKIMENSAAFNAGSGACLTLDGRVLADAAVMTGDLSCGAIASANAARNPISLARAIMEKSDHVIMAGSDNIEQFARAVGFTVQPLKPSVLRLKQYEKLKLTKIPEWPKNMKITAKYLSTLKGSDFDKNDTVGAVAIDTRGTLCSGVSTGGRWLKLPGRVGDSAIIGAGIYADGSSGAACATGLGEEIIRVCLCKTVCDFMRTGLSAQAACDAAINVLSKSRGLETGGVIAVDRHGGFGASRNTEMMSRAFRFSSMKSAQGFLLPSEDNPKKIFHLDSSKLQKRLGRF